MNREERISLIEESGREIRDNARFLRTKGYIQHGDTSVWDHVHGVAEMSLRINDFFHAGSDREALIRGALLHDFYDYDWHIKKEKVPLFQMHGFTHPLIALKNADKEFAVSEKIANIIESHMWPLTLTHAPKCREALIVNLADDIVTLKETFKRKK